MSNPPLPSDLDTLDFLTVAEVATVLRVSKMTAYRLVHSGTLEGSRIGRVFRIQASSVRAYLSDAQVNPGSS